MLIVQMPESGEQERKNKRRRRRAAGYLVALGIVMFAAFAATTFAGQAAAFAVELWLLWAVLNDPSLKR
jgi:hypothetical protein